MEDIRERMAVLETEFSHVRSHLERLDTGLYGHLTGHEPPKADPCRDHKAGNRSSDASITLRFSRRTLGGGGLVGGGLAGLAAASAKALGWW